MKFSFALIASFFVFTGFAKEFDEPLSNKVHYGYFKGGASACIPSVGVGFRHHEGASGYDFSLNAGSIVFFNYAGIKALYLHYPFHAKHRYFYWGIGGGAGVLLTAFPTVVPPGSAGDIGPIVSLEGVLGWEFFSHKKMKFFIQAEGSQIFPPRIKFPLPGLSLGMGF